MADPRILIRVPADDLPPRARLLLDSDGPRLPDTRFLARRTQVVWAPAAWLTVLLPVGAAAIVALSRGGDGRAVYAVIAAMCLGFAAVNIRALLRGLAEREQIRRGAHRLGLHLIGLEGLLVAGRAVHTWVPRALLPEAVDVTPPGGGPQVPIYAVDVTDGSRSERLEFSGPTRMALWMWAQHGVLPDGDGWV